MTASEIVRGDRSGGATTSHTVVAPALQLLLAKVGTHVAAPDYERAVLDDNVLGKSTIGARRRSLRYLRELYILRNDSLLFRALGDLWSDDSSGQPLLAGLCALARDPVFRASTQAIFDSQPGDQITSSGLAEAVAKSFPNSYSWSLGLGPLTLARSLSNWAGASRAVALTSSAG
jgi:hypothetical protein